MSLPLSSLLGVLEQIAPLGLAEAWDNVGLLVDPRVAGEDLHVDRVLLAIDATPAVLREAAAVNAQCLIAYHPPLFEAQRRWARTRHPLLFEAISHGYAVYSPHSALDAVPGGINDWLAEAFGEADVRPIVASPGGSELKLVVYVPEEHVEQLRHALADAGAGVIGNYTHCSFVLPGQGTFYGAEGAAPVVGSAGRLERVSEMRLEMVCPKRAVGELLRAIERHHPYEEPAYDFYPLARAPDPRSGAGRLVTLHEPRPLSEVIAAVKRQLGLSKLRVAQTEAHALGTPIRRIALCAGSGGSVFDAETTADVYLTGELRHHDILSKLQRGSSVILSEHSHSERGYLPRLRERLLVSSEQGLDVIVSSLDVEPLSII